MTPYILSQIFPLIKNYNVIFPENTDYDINGIPYYWNDEYWGLYLRENMTCYIFYSGTETTLDIYEGYRTGDSTNPPTQGGNTFIADGWYIDDVALSDPPDPQNLPPYNFGVDAKPLLQRVWKEYERERSWAYTWPASVTVDILCMYIYNGKNLSSKVVQVTMTQSEYQSLSI